jgi:chitodextrinase
MQVDAGSGREDDSGAYVKSAAGASHQGAVYAVAGSSSKIQGGALNHPAMFLSLNELGSMVLDIDGLRLDALFLDDVGNVLDYFTLLKGSGSQQDTEAPSVPANVRATIVTSDSISLQWDTATDNVGVTAYRVTRNGQTIATVGSTSLNDSGLLPSTSYDYAIRALDAAGNESIATTINVVTNAAAGGNPQDTEAPSVPANVRATAVTSDSISLQWDAATDNVGVTAYRVTRNGQAVATIGSTSLNDSGLLPSTSYDYTVRALDAAGNESAATTINVVTNAATVAPGHSGGSGALDLCLLLGLVGLLLRRGSRMP